jgi:hypothetical protein
LVLRKNAAGSRSFKEQISKIGDEEEVEPDPLKLHRPSNPILLEMNIRKEAPLHGGQGNVLDSKLQCSTRSVVI